jgi:hypothetical protein
MKQITELRRKDRQRQYRAYEPHPRLANLFPIVVLDTGVLVRMAFASDDSVFGRILNAWRGKGFDVVTSDALFADLQFALQEFKSDFTGKRVFRRPDIEAYLQ